MRRNEINFGGKRQISRDPGFQAGHLPNRYLELWETLFLLQRVCVCVCVCVCVMCKDFKGQGRERQRQKLSSWVPPPPCLLLLCCVTLPLYPVESHSSFLYIKGPVERYHPNQKCCDHLRVGSTGPSKVQYHNMSIYLYLCLLDLSM